MKAEDYLFLSSNVWSGSVKKPLRSSLEHINLCYITLIKNLSSPVFLVLTYSDSSAYQLPRAFLGGMGGIMQAGYFNDRIR